MAFTRRILFALLAGLLAANPAHAGFHVMQIEQIIGGVNGDVTAQAIQLRMRSSGQNLVANAQLTAVDAAGANPVLLLDMTTNVSNSAAGARVLLATSSFFNYASPLLAANFVLANPIPASYLPAGQLRFTDDFGTIYWSVSWGGAGFTGSTTGNGANDLDGVFGPPVATALPSTTLQALLFGSAASAMSTTNLAQYALTPGAATFINNAGTSFTVIAPPKPGDFNGDTHIDGQDFILWQRGNSPSPLDPADLLKWKQHYGDVPQVANIGNIPEPLSIALLLHGLILAAWTVRRGGARA